MPAHDTEPVRRSIEVEYWVVDGDGHLVEPGELVDATAGAEREFVEPLLEIKTTPCETMQALRSELLDRVGAVLRRGSAIGKHLVPLGTPVYADEIGELPDERTRVQNDVVGEDFAYVRHCAGTHIHVEQLPGREADQLNTLIAMDPALALVNSSPYYRGEQVAAGARSKLYRWLAYDGLAHQGRLWRYIDDTDEWDRRLERRYEEFARKALDAGVDRQTVESNFDPESAIWTPVQLRAEFNTVEWRSPDAALPSQVLRLAETITDVVGNLDTTTVRTEGTTGEVTDSEVVLPDFDAVVEYAEAAITEGLAAPSVRSYLDRMGFDVDAYDPIAVDIGGREPMTRDDARELRLGLADQLKEDVLQPEPAADD